MKRIIALKGRASSGKTTTIRLLPEILYANGYRAVPGKHHDFGHDFLDIFEKGEFKVGVTSSGDSYDYVFDRLTDLVDEGCNVCICASRTFGGTHAAIFAFADHTAHFEQKTYAESPSDQSVANDQDANKLFSLL